MDSSSCRLTVFTPLYNRKHTLNRAFESLRRQTFRNFEWLIVDDGSTDEPEELIAEYTAAADFKIVYIKKENGGKHTAWNVALKEIDTEYFICLDSDDALVDTAIERMLYYWDSISPEDKHKYWCVVGLDVDAMTNELIGIGFPDGINESACPRELAAASTGDKFGCLSSAIAKKFPFPEPKGTTFITESIVWNKIEKEYIQYYVNEKFCIVYRGEPDSLTSSWYATHIKEGYVSNFYWKASTLNDGAKFDAKTLFQIPYYGLMGGKKIGEILAAVDKKSFRVIIVPMLLPAALLKLINKNKYGEKSE